MNVYIDLNILKIMKLISKLIEHFLTRLSDQKFYKLINSEKVHNQFVFNENYKNLIKFNFRQ